MRPVNSEVCVGQPVGALQHPPLSRTCCRLTWRWMWRIMLGFLAPRRACQAWPMPFLRMPTALRVREPSLALPSSEAHVWYAMTADCDKPDLRNYYLSVLSDEERARLEQFAFDHLKLEYLVTHALCRTVLSTYEDIPPSAWRFSFNAYGRPEIVRPYPSPRMRFSLTNARSLVACIVTKEVDAGIDGEELNRPCEVVAIARRYFSRAEQEALLAMTPGRQRRRFFELWTLKEAYTKACGMGLSMPLDQFSLLVEQTPISIAHHGSRIDVAGHWQFGLYQPSDYHLMAVALRRGPAPDLRIRVREVVPNSRSWRKDVSCGY